MIISLVRKSLVLSLHREIFLSKGVCPEQQREVSPHGVQTLVVVDDSAETDGLMKQ